MKTSTRNFLIGTVSDIREGMSHDDVEVMVGDSRLVATITRRECEELGLKVGAEVVALIKGSSIIVVAHPHRLNFPSTNHLHGVVTQIRTDDHNGEVVVELDSGESIAAFITQGSLEGMRLEVGSRASVHFKSTSVFLATRQM